VQTGRLKETDMHDDGKEGSHASKMTSTSDTHPPDIKHLRNGGTPPPIATGQA